MSNQKRNKQSKVSGDVGAGEVDQQTFPSGNAAASPLPPQRAPNGWFLPGNIVGVGNPGNTTPKVTLAKLSGDIFTAIITRNKDRILEIFDFLFTSDNPSHWGLALKYLPLDKLMANLGMAAEGSYDFTRNLFKRIAELEAENADLKAKLAVHEGRTIDANTH